MNKYLLGILVLLVVVLIAAVGYLIYQNQKLLKDKLSQASPTASPIISPSPEDFMTVSPSPFPKLTLSEIQENTKDGVNSRNYQALASYMTGPTVSVILQATECCGELSQMEAVEQMSYINDGVPFDFNQEAALIKNLKSKNPELSGKYIGISKGSEYLVAFEINDQNKISAVRMSVSWKLFSI